MTDKKTNNIEGYGTIGLTLGIVAIVFAGAVGIIFSIIGFIFCYVQQKKKKTGFGKSGLYLNAIAFVISIAFLVISIMYYPQLVQPVS
jgi:uncharacterized membrane protein